MSFFNQYITHDGCVCCGAYVPEERQVCASCEKKSEAGGVAKTNSDEPKKICLLCASWKPKGKVNEIIRHGGSCITLGKDTKLDDTCLGWKFCSPSQLAQRKQAGLIEEVEAK